MTVAPAVLAPDPRLPQRDLLLDVPEVARRLSTRLGVGGPITIERCRRVRVKYRIGDSLRVLYCIQVRGRCYIVAARAFSGGRGQDVYRRAAADVIPCGPLHTVMHDAELDTVFWTFPNDRKIANLAVLTRVPPALGEFLGRRWIQSRVVAYAPEKAATAQCLDEAGEVVAYAKVYADDEGERTYGVHDSLWRSLPASDPHLRIPRPIAYSAAHRTLLVESIGGRRIAELDIGERRAGLGRLGAALAAFHSVAVPKAPMFKRLTAERLRQDARFVAAARPDVGWLADELVNDLFARWEPPPGPHFSLHGDVHPKNGILAGDRITLIDFDQVSAGPAAADLGSLLAGLRYDRCVGLLPEAAESELQGAFLGSYASVRELPDATVVRWYTAAAMLAERALRAVNRIRPEGLLHLDGLLADARRLLVGESGSRR